MERGNEEEGVHNTARCREQAEATADSSRWSLATQWRGTKVWEMRNVEPASILWNRKKNTNKSTMKSLVLLHVLLTMQVKSLQPLQLLLLLHNQHRQPTAWDGDVIIVLRFMQSSWFHFNLDGVLLGGWGHEFHHFKAYLEACQSPIRDQQTRCQRYTKEQTSLVMLSQLICLAGFAKDELLKMTGLLFGSISWWCRRRERKTKKPTQ